MVGFWNTGFGMLVWPRTFQQILECACELVSKSIIFPFAFNFDLTKMALPWLYILALPFSSSISWLSLDLSSLYLPASLSISRFQSYSFALLSSLPSFFDHSLSTSFLSFFPSIRLILLSLLSPPTSLFRLSITPLRLLYQPNAFSLTLLPLFLKSLFSLFSSSLSITPLSTNPSSLLLCSPY